MEPERGDAGKPNGGLSALWGKGIPRVKPNRHPVMRFVCRPARAPGARTRILLRRSLRRRRRVSSSGAAAPCRRSDFRISMRMSVSALSVLCVATNATKFTPKSNGKREPHSHSPSFLIVNWGSRRVSWIVALWEIGEDCIHIHNSCLGSFLAHGSTTCSAAQPGRRPGQSDLEPRRFCTRPNGYLVRNQALGLIISDADDVCQRHLQGRHAQG